MSRQSLFSLENSLPDGGDDWERFDLNPAVVADGGGLAFALSAVCLGPRLGDEGDPLELELECDGDPIRIAAIDQRAEQTGPRASLTVALFDVSLRLLGALTTAETVRVRLAGHDGAIERFLDDTNREHLERFLDQIRLERPAQAVASVASAGR